MEPEEHNAEETAEELSQPEKDTAARKYLLTINNPQEHQVTHEAIKQILSNLKSLLYFCMADEIGLDTHTPHTHIFIAAKSPIKFRRMKKLLPMAHIDNCWGTSRQNRDYVAKEGKWASDPKSDTRVEGSFEEWGELPQEVGQGFRTDIAEIYAKIEAGMSNAQIMAENPEAAMHIGKMDKIRLDILEEKYRDTWRDLDVTYIWGPTETGKTRSVMETHGYSNVFRVTDYNHPFDRYGQQPVLCLDEFRSSLPIGDMLDYLDGYPLALPARYANRQACYETVYIISNVPLKSQFPNLQTSEPETWRAFLRRIHHVIEYRKDGPPIDHGNALDHIFPPPSPVPDWVREAEEAEQEELPL